MRWQIIRVANWCSGGAHYIIFASRRTTALRVALRTSARLQQLARRLICAVLLRAAERTLQLAETGRYKLDALRLPTEETVAVYDICPDADSDALLVADGANRCVKAVAASGRAALVFQCGADSSPVALQLVRPVAGEGAALLLVEWLTAEQQAAHYALVVAARSGQRFDETRRLPLPALSKQEPLAAVSMATTSGGFVLIGNSRAKALDMIDARDSSSIARLAAPLPLDFALWHFSVGAADGRELLAATEVSSRTVRVLQVEASSGAPALRPLAGLTAGDESHLLTRVLLFGRHVLLSMWHASIQSHAVECVPFSGAPLRQPLVLRAERQVWVNCWRAAGERVLLFDKNHRQLQSLECASLAALCTRRALCCTVESGILFERLCALIFVSDCWHVLTRAAGAVIIHTLFRILSHKVD